MGFYVLDLKERTSVEKKIKQIWKSMENQPDHLQGDQADNLNRSSAENSASSSSRSISSASSIQSRKRKSVLSSFLHSVSDKQNASTTPTTHSKSIGDEVVLYRSMALKEVQRTIDTDSNPDVSQFW